MDGGRDEDDNKEGQSFHSLLFMEVKAEGAVIDICQGAAPLNY